MERNWYVICTKQQQEKNAVKLLTKKGIENYCPFTNVEKKKGNRSSLQFQPLFNSYVFVFITKTEMETIKKMPYIINMVYWKSEPVTINEEEINAVRLMEENYMNIKLTKTNVSINEKINFVEKNSTGYNQHSISIKHQGLTISLPSLGYTMVAERAKERSGKNLIERKFTITSFFPKILSLLFSLGV